MLCATQVKSDRHKLNHVA